MANEITMFVHKSIEYDATEGKDLFRFSASSEWMQTEDFKTFISKLEVGTITIKIVQEKGSSDDRRRDK